MKSNNKVYIKILDNRIGRFILKFYFFLIIPLYFLTPVLLVYLNEPKPFFFKGKVTKQYDDVAYLNGRKGKRKDEKCITLELNDSINFILLQYSARNILKNNKILNDTVFIQYKILPRYRHELSDLIETLTFEKENEDYIKNRMPYFSIKLLATKDRVLVNESKGVILIVFLLFFISITWFLLGVINDIKRIWLSVPEKRSINGLGISKPSQNNHGKIIKNFSSCPACGMRLKDSDIECPDCGLNFN
ncbi:hypothetical protein LX69_00564 [Breznakibacter xylanolyticus]|uniref:Uncharacterized protein n=1 Tax=Breznakibacter xylanolyticus TaxID=990 RepID=A0A2W7NI46_9BACT|nr:hypothetical protein [Breznakibacter xylanolyticus]PZX20111.1 hypothetical protein LX69_00564 [Breznakibacter xylanolyticus]